MQLDFAHLAGNCLVVYGWIAGLSGLIDSAHLQIDEWQADLLELALPVDRPDVSAHLGADHPALAGDPALHDRHGFFALCELDDDAPAAVFADDGVLSLRVCTRDGLEWHLEKSIVHGAHPLAQTLRHHEPTVRALLRQLPSTLAQRLAGLFDPPLLLAQAESGVARGGDLLAPQWNVVGTLDDALVLLGSIPCTPDTFERLEMRLGPRAAGGGMVDLLPALRELPTPFQLPPSVQDDRPAPMARGALVVLPGRARAASQYREAELHFRRPAGFGRTVVSLRQQPGETQRRLLAWLNAQDPVNRIAACEHLLDSLPGDIAEAGWRDAVLTLLDATLETLGTCVEVSVDGHPVSLYVDQAVPVIDHGLLVTGWFNADPAAAVTVTCHVDGRRHPLSGHWVRRPRADVQQHLLDRGLGHVDEPGFVSLVRLPGCRLRLRSAYVAVRQGRNVWYARLSVPRTAEPARQLVRTLLSTVNQHSRDLRQLLDEHVGPAIGKVWASRPAPHSPAQRWQFGPVVEAPTVSLVIPLFGRNDLADYQLALFTDDPELHAAEIIFVMDDPSVLHEFRRRCADMHRMHGLSFTLAAPGDNLGFAGATNHGARLARAPWLLLLNSDVFPKAPGWLGRLIASHRAHPDTGLLGAKLLYEDGSVQHAGMDCVRHEPWQGMWINRHPHKGLPPDPLTGLREVPAVTAACVLVETDFYRALGGLSEDYIIGDFEDSDLCFRARAAGRRCRVDLDVTLYHLERQSQDLGDSSWRTALTLYNCWVHDQRWNSLIAEQMQ